MAVIAANITNETVDLISTVLDTPEITNFSRKNKLDLSVNTTLLRLAIINLIKHLPSSDEVVLYKTALLRPREFDNFWKQMLGVVDNGI